ncbi:hypothetical protein Mapa_012044 [Marchantia paleacea]|nr:hypothetical protein Mapa_012044 [Marchantia paleacea]
MGAEADNVDFRSLFEEKEKELVGICERQIEFFHHQYNLELLDERDAELTNYEAELAALQVWLINTPFLSTPGLQHIEEDNAYMP